MVFEGIIGFRGNNWKIIHTNINVNYIGMPNHYEFWKNDFNED